MSSTSSQGKCVSCGGPTPRYHNYCSWECSIQLAKRNGGVVHTPNNLPIRCIKHDNTMLEHAHGDHPDYKFPVVAEYMGKDPDKFKTRDEQTNELIHDGGTETHALIYTDGSIALTMYECCYTVWSLRDGAVLAEHLWYKKGEWKLNELSLTQIREHAKREA